LHLSSAKVSRFRLVDFDQRIAGENVGAKSRGARWSDADDEELAVNALDDLCTTLEAVASS
jgi:hypothetical protein